MALVYPKEDNMEEALMCDVAALLMVDHTPLNNVKVHKQSGYPG